MTAMPGPTAKKPKLDESEYTRINEGNAHILLPGKVFYNPVQQFNRDLSVLGIQTWSQMYRAAKPLDPKYVKIVEPLSASGLRSIRYSREIEFVKSVLANDNSPSAVDLINKNVALNSCNDTINVSLSDANALLHTIASSHKKVHVVDLDPYGSATPFIDAAVQSVVDDGLVLVTCTDLGVLAGQSHPEKCFAQYGGTGISSDACHEAALRLVLHMIATSAAKYGLAITPLLSLSIDFYVRVFVRIKRSPYQVKFNASKTMLVLHCRQCTAFATQPLGRVSERGSAVNFQWSKVSSGTRDTCVHCQSSVSLCGPMWAGDLHDASFVDHMIRSHSLLDKSVYKTWDRMLGMLKLVQAELQAPTESWLYVCPASLASVIKVTCPPLRSFVNGLLNAGYTATPTHAKPGCVKTNAPFSVVWDVMRAWWVQETSGCKSKNLAPSSAGHAILANCTDRVPVSFDDNSAIKHFDEIRESNLVRYQVNPSPNWGPKARAGSRTPAR